MDWTWLRFADLGVDNLHDALQLRCRVFILEQGPYLDVDGIDRQSWHLLGRDDASTLVAYLRVVDPAVKYAEPSIGRVITAPDVRGSGLGRTLMREGLAGCAVRWPGRATLEATAEADLLQHVIDSASLARERQIEAVDKVLAVIGADAVPQLRVYNKLDLTGVAPGVGRDEYGKLQSVYVSAQTGAGLELLRDALTEILLAGRGQVQISQDEAGMPDDTSLKPTAFST